MPDTTTTFCYADLGTDSLTESVACTVAHPSRLLPDVSKGRERFNPALPDAYPPPDKPVRMPTHSALPAPEFGEDDGPSDHAEKGASPFKHLQLGELFAIAMLADQREAAWQATGASPIDHLEGLKGPEADVMHQLGSGLRERILALPSESARELVALTLLADRNRSAPNLTRALDEVDANPNEHAAHALHRNLSLHRYLSHGLHRIGQAGWSVITHYPQMFSWLNLDSPDILSKRHGTAPTLGDFAEVERQLRDACEQADLKCSFEDLDALVGRCLTRSKHFDEVGNDETFAFISRGYRERHHGLAAVICNIQIGRAYYYQDHDEIAAKRLGHARVMLSSLREVIKKGDRITAQSPKGGVGRARKIDPVKREFARLLSAGERGIDWHSKDAAVAALYPQMRAFNDSLKPPPLRSDRMDGTLRSWLDTDAMVRAAYFDKSKDIPA